jgi:hypothetical protein
MNGYQPEGDTEFLTASLEAHKDALKQSQQKVERLEKILELAYNLPAKTDIEFLNKWSYFVHQYCSYKETEE